MKVSTAALILSLSAPLVVAEGGLKGAAITQKRSLQQTQDFGDLPTLEEMEQIYNGYCALCALGEIFGQDSTFCPILCGPDNTLPPITLPPFDPDLDQCFSEISTVQLEGVGAITMKDLKIGDRVLTNGGIYEPVFAWGHKNPTTTADFYQFQMAGATLEATEGHLVYLEGKTNPVRADSIKVGDVLKADNKDGTVKKITTVQRDGIYTPLTPSGTVVVDGAVASSYISLQKTATEHVELQGGIPTFMSYQDFIHMTLSPFRMFCMGVSSDLGNVYTEDGVPVYAAYGMELLHWANRQNIFIQALVLFAVFIVTGACMILENTFGASMAPAALVAGVGMYAFMKHNNVSLRAQKIKTV